MLMITREYEFEAAHYIPNHLGKCRHLHGHSYKLQVTVSGELMSNEKSPKYMMIMDFADLDRIVKPIIEHSDSDENKGLDHNILNNVFDYPTAEVMAVSLAKQIQARIDNAKYKNIFVERVDLWETSRSFASWVRSK